MKKNWLNENIIPLMAIMLLLFIFSSFLLMLTGCVKSEPTLTNTILDTEKSVLLLLVGYYFGSSKGSKDKDEVIKEESKS